MTKHGVYDGQILDDDDSRAVAASLPVYTIPQVADYLVNGFWENRNSQARSWPADHHTITFNLDAIDADRKPLATMALATWAEVTGLTFEQTSGTADITFTETGSKSAVTDTSFTNDFELVSATVNISFDWSTSSAMDSYLFQTFIHEIGHALGLGHAGNYNGRAAYGVDNHYQNETLQYTIMSYMSQSNYGGASNRTVMTPQMADIYAVQSVYGVGEARSGDTTYGFHASGQAEATKAIYDFDSYATAPALTIYDSGGTDTLDCSGYSQSQKISLVSGSWSNVGGLVGNIGIYRSTVIEDAVGGSGRDRIFGNKADNDLKGRGGDDHIAGGLGDDSLSGGGMADIFVFKTGWDRDAVSDFKGADRIDLRSFDFDNFKEVKAIAHTSDGDLILNFGQGDTLTIDHFTKADMLARDFIL